MAAKPDGYPAVWLGIWLAEACLLVAHAAEQNYLFTALAVVVGAWAMTRWRNARAT